MNPTFVDPQRVLAKALAAEGKPYIWTRKGPDAFDCSGLITWALKEVGGPDWRFYRNAHMLFANNKQLEELGSGRFAGLALEPVSHLQPGEIAICCYGYPTNDGGHCNHVMLSVGDGRVFGACGGDETTVDLAAAFRRGAKVRFRPSPTYLPNLLGYRRLAYASVPVLNSRPGA